MNHTICIQLSHQKDSNQETAIDKLKKLSINASNKTMTIEQKIQMIDLLGGPNTILNVFLNYYHIQTESTDEKETEEIQTPNMKCLFSETQMQSLIEIFEDTDEKTDDHSILSLMQKMDVQTIKKQQKSFSISMIAKNDFWHLLLSKAGVQTQIADKISSFVTSKWMIVLFGILFLCFLLSYFVTNSMYYTISINIFSLLLVWTIMLAINVSMVRFMLGSFLLWFKIFHVLKYCVFFSLYTIEVEESEIELYVVQLIVFSIGFMSLSLGFCLVDGLHCPWMKIMLSILISIIFIIQYLFIFYGFQPEIGFIFFGIGFISYRSQMLSSLLTLIIFFGKQGIWTIINQKRASVFKISPAILWVTVDCKEVI